MGLDGRDWPPDRLDPERKQSICEAHEIEATGYNNDFDDKSEKSVSIISAVPEKPFTVQ